MNQTPATAQDPFPFVGRATVQAEAKYYRMNNGERDTYLQHGLVVLKQTGRVSGWMNELRNPQGWEPGCYAVDINGSVWRTNGGNSHNGAKE